MAEQRHDGPDHKEGGSGQVGNALVAASSFGCAPPHINEEGTQLGQTMAVHRQNIFLHILWLGLCCVLLESLQTKSGTAAVTFVDDLMDILIEGTPGAMKLRDATNDKNSHKNLKKSDVSWNQAKRRVSSCGWGLTPRRTWPNVALCSGRAASPKQSGILDVGLKWEEERAQ